jgi:transposase-like protein
MEGFELGGAGPCRTSRGANFGAEIVLRAVRWYCCYGISYRDLEQMNRQLFLTEPTRARLVSLSPVAD